MMKGRHLIRFVTESVTDAHVDVSPDGKHILFDLLGDLYTLPMTGGEAMPLTQGPAWDVQGRYSPDGRKIAWVSDRGGNVGLWSMDADGTTPVGYAAARHDWTLTAAWTPGGRLMDITTEGLMEFEDPMRQRPAFCEDIDIGLYRGSFSKDGCQGYTGGNGLCRVDLATGTRMELISTAGSRMIMLPCPSPDNRMVAYMASQYSPDLGEQRALRVLDMTSGEDRELADSISVDLVLRYDFTPDGRYILLCRLGKLIRIEVATGRKERIPFRVAVSRDVAVPLHGPARKVDTDSIETRIVRWPSVAASGNTVIYSAWGKLFTQWGNETPRRLTTDQVFEFAPTLSPDAQWVAYTTWDDRNKGHVMIVPSGGGQPRQITAQPGRYTNPAWSPDGAWLTFVSDTTAARLGLMSRHQGGNTLGWNLMLCVASGFMQGGGKTEIGHIMSVTPLGAEPGRFYPVPVISNGGKRIFTTTYQSTDDISGPVLLSVRPDGTDVKHHLRLPAADEVVVSPDARHVALVVHDRLWVVDIPAHVSATTPAVDLHTARLMTSDAPTYVSWQDSETLVWAAASKVFKQRMAEAAATLVARVNNRRPYARPRADFAIINARLITMRGDEVIERGTVIVRNNRIAQVGPSASVRVPNGMFSFDLAGKTVLPGFIEAHGHVHHAGKELWQRQNRVYIGSLAYGITSIYDPSANTMDVFGQSEMVNIGAITAPRIFSSGSPISVLTEGDLATPAEAAAVVEHRARYGASPVKEYLQPHREQRQWLVRAARQQGVLITSHYGADGTDMYEGLTRITDGFTAIEHELRTGPLYDDVVQFVAKSQVNYTPTPGGNTMEMLSKRPSVDDARINRFNPRFLIEEENAIYKSQGYRAMAGAFRMERNSSMQNLANIVRHGGLLGVSAHGNGIPGLATHLRLWAYTAGGMPIHDALRAATLNGARKLDLDTELGSIETGKLADLVVLNANPLDDIKRSIDIHFVIKDGFIYEAATMTRLWPSRKTLDPWPWEP
jgi:imidazolonepropionase-like amidohydrolase/Tol biopolymer transport system component